MYYGFNGDLMGFCGGLMGSNGISDWIYPLVNVYITNWKITMLLMGKSTKFLWAMFNSYICMFTIG